MKSIVLLLGLISASALASPVGLVYYPQQQGVQAIYDNFYVGYAGKGRDDTTVIVKENYGVTQDQTYISTEREWFDYNVQVGMVGYTDYKVYPFAGLTYSNDRSNEVITIDSQHYATYDHSDHTVGFEAGLLYEFYPHALAGLKFSTQYETVHFGLGVKF